MQRCIQLALLGKGSVAPNPMVGSVLVHEERIIGEGYHMQYGQEHAEVNCINSVTDEDIHLIPQSTIYVSLEPCAHFGKTPPCSDFIIKHNIKKVVVGCRDPFKEVNGKGIEKLQQHGIEITMNVLEKECLELNKRFFTFHTKQRPYIILKWAQTANHKIAALGNKRLLISNDVTNRLAHKLRSEEAGILVGTNTALKDNPSLNNRLWSGNNPIRLVIDKQLTLPATLNVFNREQRTVIFNFIKQEENDNLLYFLLKKEENILEQILHACYQLNIQSVLVEGGTTTLQSFIDNDLWDEARVITNENLIVDDGLAAPVLKHFQQVNKINLLDDTISWYQPF